MKTCNLLIVIFVATLSTQVAADILDGGTERGFLAIGLFYGMGESKLLNMDNSDAGYRLTGQGLDLGLRLWHFDDGELWLTGNYVATRGKNASIKSDTSKTEETYAGLKVFAGSYIYFSLGIGTGRTVLHSSQFNQDIDFGYQTYRSAIGVEVSIAKAFLFGLEVNHRNAPIRKQDNSQLSENTYMESTMVGVRMIWSPPQFDLSSY